MKFKPLGERVLIKMVEREEHEAGGIVLPDTAKKKPQTAEVIEVGTFEEGYRLAPGTWWSCASTRGSRSSLRTKNT